MLANDSFLVYLRDMFKSLVLYVQKENTGSVAHLNMGSNYPLVHTV